MILAGLSGIILVEIYAAVMQREFQNTDSRVGKGFAVLGIYMFVVVYCKFAGSLTLPPSDVELISTLVHGSGSTRATFNQNTLIETKMADLYAGQLVRYDQMECSTALLGCTEQRSYRSRFAAKSWVWLRRHTLSSMSEVSLPTANSTVYPHVERRELSR